MSLADDDKDANAKPGLAFMLGYIKWADRINYRIGRMAMYGIFVMMAILLWSSVSKTFFTPSLWTLEMAQFSMVAYYVLGGPYSLQDKGDSHVRMDLFYGSWSPKTKAWVDAFSIICVVFFLGVLLYGAIDSASYAIQYGERSNTAWRPFMWPIKVIMCIGFVLMLVQAVSEFFKDVARIQGVDI